LPDNISDSLNPLLDTILTRVAPASDPALDSEPLLLQPFNLAYDNFLGRCAIARVYQGIIKNGQAVFVKDSAGQVRSGKITKLFTFRGLVRQEIEAASVGDIVFLAGLSDIYIGETVCSQADQPSLPAIKIDLFKFFG